ncbi:MAG: (R)-hydratase [Magnetococcales bacterium]|nr:(R)-hydratase [Magnetococcales bacterium]
MNTLSKSAAPTRFEPGQTVRCLFTVTMAQQRDYARLTGDANPVHLDGAFARELGFAGPLVFGGLLAAQVGRGIGMDLPGAGCVWSQLVIRFSRPLLVDQPAELTLTVDHFSPGMGVLSLRFTIRSGEVGVASGTAMATLRAPQEGSA